MISRLAAAALAALCLASPGASAQTTPDVDCANAMTQMEMTFCAEQDWIAADAALNAAWAPAMARMRALDAHQPADLKGAADALRAAQRAWVSYRDLACTAEGYQMRGGSAEPMVIYGCRARLTEARTEELQALAAPM
ncbi:lysozyme inhibitor LprI family protein [Frigidibacter mobilis]|uniref:Urease-associated protein n=1 Tax=Frigidibacter mobilis TaxID=1335048 RepID=A0A159Z519_9RHOB|nr:lysozyme inhibitor LprI family protein [Frigidibacter mobilis]AMY69424.1 urease-associated protein [Frigidibacter mobilis]